MYMPVRITFFLGLLFLAGEASALNKDYQPDPDEDRKNLACAQLGLANGEQKNIDPRVPQFQTCVQSRTRSVCQGIRDQLEKSAQNRGKMPPCGGVQVAQLCPQGYLMNVGGVHPSQWPVFDSLQSVMENRNLVKQAGGQAYYDGCYRPKK